MLTTILFEIEAFIAFIFFLDGCIRRFHVNLVLVCDLKSFVPYYWFSLECISNE